MGKEQHVHRGDLGMVLKAAAGLTAAGLGCLGARHLVSSELANLPVTRACCS